MKLKLTLLAVVAIAVITAFIFMDLPHNWDYALPKRIKKILAIILTGGAIAYATLIFQTMTNNRILTPSIIGLDSLYMLIQTFVIFIFGSMSITNTNKELNFVITVGIMILFVGLLYRLIFKREGKNLFFLLLIGLVMGTLFGSLSTFMQVMIDPNEFMALQQKMFASFNNVNTDLLLFASILIGLTLLYGLRFTKYLDAMSLGKEHAVNLGIPYDYVVKSLLVIVAILIAISTALVGPITFLGLLVVNLAYQFMNTYRHSILIPGAILISVIALVGGQLIVERVFTFETTVSVIINFIGGAYFLYLLLRESKS
ncbi:iron chelate uptake ABC transporter family permease subunit [Paenibacillus sp. GSMTC-2017]|uniref:iron chelate uptake ABC transporter family permease subunit n=1 Tax=Paenibacillus sp. GSMTC-2017 TaxID=2794350 RepID=UPI0018D8D5DA|nr:iron chelate uptake ABC transporter family permease subunit [Paenibacillus sp. GSMTC-2017]MBH5320169.1 iron chelate uptake ABC transporter family permease subunit [Paenibacillus sp. GSMTC-2017]